MHSCKLIAIDMDGTLLGSDYAISETNRRWLLAAREEGIEFTIATGRLFKGIVQMYARQLAIAAPIITINGSAVWSADGELIESHFFTEEDVRHLYGLARETEIPFWAHMLDEAADKETFEELMAQRSWSKFVFVDEDLHAVDRLWERLLLHGGFEVTSTSRHNIEVNPPGVSKASGLAVACSRMGVTPAEVVAIG
ncbi:MAG: HAD-IIB family hydrolase, partial [Bacilli bacterium]